jgi:hypothetical protein
VPKQCVDLFAPILEHERYKITIFNTLKPIGKINAMSLFVF